MINSKIYENWIIFDRVIVKKTTLFNAYFVQFFLLKVGQTLFDFDKTLHVLYFDQCTTLSFYKFFGLCYEKNVLLLISWNFVLRIFSKLVVYFTTWVDYLAMVVSFHEHFLLPNVICSPLWFVYTMRDRYLMFLPHCIEFTKNAWNFRYI